MADDLNTIFAAEAIDGLVEATILQLRNGLGASIGAAAYSIFADMNGNGVIAVNDVLPLRNNLGRSLPQEEPTPTPEGIPALQSIPVAPTAAAAAVDEVFSTDEDELGLTGQSVVQRGSRSKSAFVA